MCTARWAPLKPEGPYLLGRREQKQNIEFYVLGQFHTTYAWTGYDIPFEWKPPEKPTKPRTFVPGKQACSGVAVGSPWHAAR